ncbi:MAG TPA: hypothetical protein VGM39_10940 [Kofleriaceae bacterium]|jgi:poly(3-hydroxybutyrate) depolymerase
MRSVFIALIMMTACGDDAGQASADDAPGSDGGTPVDSAPIAANRSAGCDMATANTPAMFVKRTVMTSRDLWVRTPTNYDPSRAYPVIYELHGCSDAPTRETNNVPVENQVGDNAIVVRARAAASCWDSSTGGADLPYIDAMMTDVEGAFCVDTSKRFLSGYSSGSFMTHFLGCVRGDKFRATVNIAGGQTAPNCTGDPAVLMIHDTNDNTVNISVGMATRDDHLKRNQCAMPATSSPIDPSPCVEYAGCAEGKRVVWCQTAGHDHDRQDAFAAPLFWSFIQANL